MTINEEWNQPGIFDSKYGNISGNGDTIVYLSACSSNLSAYQKQDVKYTLQLSGTFGGGTVDLLGKNIGHVDEYVALKDQTGANVTFTAGGIVVIDGNIKAIKLSLSGATTPTIHWSVS